MYIYIVTNSCNLFLIGFDCWVSVIEDVYFHHICLYFILLVNIDSSDIFIYIYQSIN